MTIYKSFSIFIFHKNKSNCFITVCKSSHTHWKIPHLKTNGDCEGGFSFIKCKSLLFYSPYKITLTWIMILVNKIQSIFQEVSYKKRALSSSILLFLIVIRAINDVSTIISSLCRTVDSVHAQGKLMWFMAHTRKAHVTWHRFVPVESTGNELGMGIPKCKDLVILVYLQVQCRFLISLMVNVLFPFAFVDAIFSIIINSFKLMIFARDAVFPFWNVKLVAVGWNLL